MHRPRIRRRWRRRYRLWSPIPRGSSIIRQVVDRLSRDFYWYSPVLKKLLDGKRGDIVVQPVSAEEIASVLAYCYAT